jgi:hypothetical protein
MGHLIRVFGQDWYRLAAPEGAGRPLSEVLPDWVDRRPVCFTQSPPRNPHPPNFWIFRFKRGKMLKHWDKGLFFDRAAAEFIPREEHERRHPGILARDAPEAGEPARRALPPLILHQRQQRVRGCEISAHRRRHQWSDAMLRRHSLLNLRSVDPEDGSLHSSHGHSLLGSSAHDIGCETVAIESDP